MVYVICIVCGYLVGCINPAYFMGKAKGFDIREKGSGNAGASNATITMGWFYGIFTAVFDIAKASGSVILAKMLFPEVEMAGLLAGTACVFGHIFPFYLKFKGGKGYASYTGVMLAMNWKIALIMIFVGVVITFVTNFIPLATLTTIVFYPVYYWCMHMPHLMWLLVLAMSLVMLYKHRINIIRIIKGEEIGLRTMKEHREP